MLDVARARPADGGDGAARQRAELLELIRPGEQLLGDLEELLGRGDLDPAPPLEHLHRILEVLHVWGPKSTGFPCAAGSSTFCPPRVTKLPPTKTSVASR